MIIRFLGTRGYIKISSPLHRRHSSLLVLHGRTRVMIDCGEDWRGVFRELRPDAIFITHAHPDHAWGLKGGADCPVYASAASWEIMKKYPVAERVTVEHGKPVVLPGLTFEPFEVVHSIRAPASGYRVTGGGASFFYVPDVVYIVDHSRALAGISLYIGDGATVVRSMVRRKGNIPYGHTPIRTQLAWCGGEGVARAIFTHCGTEIVSAGEREAEARVRLLGEERGVAAEIAHDGREISLS